AFILSMLNAEQSAHSIASSTGIHVSTISRLCSKECHPTKLSSANHNSHAICLISSDKTENAVQVTKALTNVVNEPISTSTVHWHLKKTGMKAIVKSKHPLLSAKH
ncbi:hypothetical protein J3A83DRAFT_4233540, partial [Scleroderma citrinum]